MTTLPNTFSEGDLVTSLLFGGIAKIVRLHPPGKAEIAWFVSPLEYEVNRQMAETVSLTPAKLYEESTVFFRSPERADCGVGGVMAGNVRIISIW